MEDGSKISADAKPLKLQAEIAPKTMWLGYGACALAGCLWGTGFYFGRLALDEMAVEWMVLYRFFFAALGMLPVMLVHRGGRLVLELDDAKPGSGLTLSKSGGMTYVKALYLGDLGVELSFVTPKVSKLAKLAKSQTATSASASGAH